MQFGEGSAGAGGSDSVADAAVHCAVQAETVLPESVAGGSSVGAEEGSGKLAAVVSHPCDQVTFKSSDPYNEPFPKFAAGIQLPGKRLTRLCACEHSECVSSAAELQRKSGLLQRHSLHYPCQGKFTDEPSFDQCQSSGV